jgi:hypothetical protein
LNRLIGGLNYRLSFGVQKLVAIIPSLGEEGWLEAGVVWLAV